MRLLTKWLLVSVGGGLILSAVFIFAPDSWTDPLLNLMDTSDPVAVEALQVVFWPVSVCVHLSGPGAPIGPPEKHMYEGTPVQMVAALLGIALSWTFYSSLVFLVLWWRKERSKRALN